jgi:hypothetical protein
MDAMNSTSADSTLATVPDWLPLLAAAVVQQAMSDAMDPALSPSVRREARRFLAGSADYRFWGQFAEGRALIS